MYEDFLQDPRAVLLPAWSRLGLRPGKIDPDVTRHRPQATPLNSEFVNRFLSEAEDVSALHTGASAPGRDRERGI